MRSKTVVLTILDGWGVAPPGPGNAIHQAQTPVLDGYVRNYPALTLDAGGEAVGLSRGQPGNSEAGHRTIAAGRPVEADFPRITKAIQEQRFFKNATLQRTIQHCKRRSSTLHFVGLISSAGVHSHIDHILALLEFARREEFDQVVVHAILDGRDIGYNSGVDLLERLQTTMHELGVGKVASVVGRALAMDRDGHWENTEKAYNAIVHGQAEVQVTDPIAGVQQFYAAGVYDEEVPAVVVLQDGKPTATVKDGDAVVFFNFRADRIWQLVSTLTSPAFGRFERGAVPHNLRVVTMTDYDVPGRTYVLFPPPTSGVTLTQIVSAGGLQQLRVAETEKFPLVTSCFNGSTSSLPNVEDRLIPSLGLVSYGSHPAMSAPKIAETVVAAILSEKYELIVANFANADMLAHTGDEVGTQRAVQIIDRLLGEIGDAVLAKDGLLIITSDHGNAEQLVNPHTGKPDRYHTSHPVPFVAVANDYHGRTAGLPDTVGNDLSLRPPAGTVADIAPTILKALGLAAPKEMTGKPLL